MKIDIDHLHQVIDGNISGRRTGQSYALCMQIIGYIQLGEIKQIAIGLAHMRHMVEFQTLLISLMKENDIWLTSKHKAGLSVVWSVGAFSDPDDIVNASDSTMIHITELTFMPTINKIVWESGRGNDHLYVEDYYQGQR